MPEKDQITPQDTEDQITYLTKGEQKRQDQLKTAIEKQEEKVKKPKQKRRFIMTVEGLAPVRLELETWAYNEDEALKQLENPRLCRIRQRPDVDIPRLRKAKVRIKDAITSLVKLVKQF